MEKEDGVGALGQRVVAAVVGLPADSLTLALRVVGLCLGVRVDVGLVVLVRNGPIVHVTVSFQQKLSRIH